MARFSFLTREDSVQVFRVRSIFSSLAILLVGFFACGADAQEKSHAAAAGNTNPNTTIDPKLYGAMKWRLIGPFRGGRALAVTGVVSQPNTYYMGAVAGGVWKTADGGLTWDPLFDKQSVSSIGAIAVSDSDPNVVYAGTGEACIRGNISFGDGVYRSNDGGKSWTNVGLKDSRHIGAVIVHPTNPDVVFVAALGHAYGANTERGIFRTRDGGKTWEKVLYLDDRTGGIDVVFDPHNPHVLFAAMWEGYRTPWALNSGGTNDGLFRSNDDGSTWKRVEGHGMPEGPLGRIGVSVSGEDSNVVYALIEAKKGGLYRSDDGGENWALINEDHRFRQRAWYFTHVWADPKDAYKVYIANTGLFRSTDGGKTFDRINAPHGDHHGLWIDPNNPNRMINANDGGATISVDGGRNWSTQNNQPTAQFYHITADNDFPYHIYGTQQDNSSVGIATASDHGYIDRSDWDAVGGGESGYVAVDPRDSNILYAGSYFGDITRYDKRTHQAQNIQQWPLDPDGYNAAAQKYRYTWTMPIVFSPHDPNELYHSAQFLFRSTDGGHSWQTISPDLTRNDKSKQQDSGGPITRDQASIEFYDLIFTVAESPKQKGVIWAGTDDGLIQLTRDDGKHWSNVTPKGFPEWAMISLIEPSPFDAGTAYAAIDAHKLDNFKAYIFKTADFGKTWTMLTTGLPDGSYVHAVREDPKRKGMLYAGTETGIWVSFDDGAHWQSLQLNLPTTPIHDLIIHDDDLLVATHGRSFWSLDNIDPLRQMNTTNINEDARLFAPSAVLRTRMGHSRRRRYAIGENPDNGAPLYYFLKVEPKEPAKLEILDAQGKVIRTYSSEEKKTEGAPDEGEKDAEAEHIPAKAGANLFFWDLRYEPPVKIPAAIYDEGDPVGPLVMPGTYQARLTIAGKTSTAPIEVKIEPRIKTSTEDLQKQFDLMLKLRDRQEEMNRAILAIRDLRVQLNLVEKRWSSKADAKPVIEQSKELRKKIGAIEDELIQVNSKASEDELNYPTKMNSWLGYLQGAVDSADAQPTEGELGVFADLTQKLDVRLAKWHEVLATDVPAINEAMHKNGIPLISANPEATH
jgi:photosystem II stability/assembly factor-like uncharacterized protein